MPDTKVLVVEDDRGFARTVVEFLGKNELEAEAVETGADLLKAVDRETFGCIILDLGLPDEDGIVLLRKLRARSDFVPIIVVTGRQEIEDKLASFELGADDYVTKPVDLRELVVRIQAVMRRVEQAEGTSRNIIHLDTIVLDHDRREAYDRDGGLISLTPAEFALIWVLANADGKVLSRDILVDAISTGEGPLSFRAVDILVSRVRKKLAKEAVLTVPNAGYKCGWAVAKT